MKTVFTTFLLRVFCSAVLLLCISVDGAIAGMLLLHSTENATPWTDALASGVSAGLEQPGLSQVYIGSASRDDEHFEDQFDLLANAWKADQPTLVVADGQTAFAFMRKYREDIFVGVPVIYCGMTKPNPEYLRQCGDCTGIPLAMDIQGTIDLIFRLRPATTTVVGIMDATEGSRLLRLDAENAMDQYMGQAEILFPGYEPGDETGLDLAKLRSVASSVPKSGAVLFLGFEQDNAGNAVDPATAAALLVDTSVAPVFAVTDQWMGSGMLGGVMVSPQAQGREVALLAKRIFAGEPAREMLPEAVRPRATVDLTVLARFGLSEERLSAGTVTMNAPALPDEEDSTVTTGLVVLVAALISLIGLFSRLRRSRHKDR